MEALFVENLLELLLSLVLAFNVAAYNYLHNKIRKIEDRTDKNEESMNNVLNRIFGLDEDSTSEGHLQETESRFQNIDNKLEEISQKQDESIRERKREHREVSQAIDDIVLSLSKEDELDFDESDVR